MAKRHAIHTQYIRDCPPGKSAPEWLSESSGHKKGEGHQPFPKHLIRKKIVISTTRTGNEATASPIKQALPYSVSTLPPAPF